MNDRPFPSASPALDAPLASAPASQFVLDWLAGRRSTGVAQLAAPGPSRVELAGILRLAARVPDHGKLAPWRFIVFEGEARHAASRLLEARLRAREPGLPEARYEAERVRLARAPVVVAVVSRADPSHPKIPEWEQVLSAGAVALHLLLVARAMGFAGQWLTDWCAYDRDVLAALGLAASERLAGFIHLGTAVGEVRERARPEVEGLVRYWEA